MNSSHLKSSVKKRYSDHILPSDLEALQHAHQFVRDDNTDEQYCDDWKVRMARRCYDKLFKEYAVIDLSRYQEGRYGLRWRTEKEVIERKGQCICAAKHCLQTNKLCVFEVLFKYSENGATKRELVKVCLCDDCSEKLKLSDGKQKCPTEVYKDVAAEAGSGRKKQRI